MNYTDPNAEMKRDTVQASIQNAESCISLFDDAIYCRRHIARDCLKIRARVSELTRGVRNLDARALNSRHAAEKDLDALYDLCCRLHGLCGYFQNNSGALSGLLLKQPSIELSGICMELELLAAPKRRALAN
ncbi:MAG: hypothetical protein LBH94_01570 [Deltaproteobacteria bacterium]|nr:hypothetical protein [Deltaproteobacteria bacterium]